MMPTDGLVGNREIDLVVLERSELKRGVPR